MDEITPEEFVRVYQTSARDIDVARKLKITTSSVAARAMRYRMAGVRLRPRSEVHTRTYVKLIDVPKLNKLIEQLDKSEDDIDIRELDRDLSTTAQSELDLMYAEAFNA